MEDLTQLRREIDHIDEKILMALKERVQICRTIGEIKRKIHLPVKDLEREEEIISRIKLSAEELDLDPLQIITIYREIVNMCCTVQE